MDIRTRHHDFSINRSQFYRDFQTRLIFVLACFSLLGVSIAEGQQPDFPYQALVSNPTGAQVYSGPGLMHYATQALEPNDLIEVYRHDPGGWCAIRPIEGHSFSLVPEKAVTIISENVAEVTQAGVQAWVGTALGPVENPLWQVKLKKGEQLEILGEVSWPNPEGHSTIWYQIAAPAGEFRWIHLDSIRPLHQNSLDESPKSPNPVETTPIVSTDEPVSVLQVAHVEPIAHPTTTVLEPSKIVPKEKLKDSLTSIPMPEQQWLAAKTPTREIALAVPQIDSPLIRNQAPNPPRPLQSEGIRNEQGYIKPVINLNRFSDSPSVMAEAISSPPAAERFADSATAFGTVPAYQYPISPPSVSVVSSVPSMTPISSQIGVLSPRLQSMDLRLSQQVVKPTAQWQLNDIAIAVQQIINRPVNSSERLSAERMFSKISNFQAIQDNAKQTDGQVALNAAAKPGISDVNHQTLYDAQGWLSELVQNRGSVESTFVLQDDQGRITHHVQPAPGLNLHRYLKSKVGILGSRGFHQQLNLNHVQAERIIVLQEKR